jgi:hypothetical protein
MHFSGRNEDVARIFFDNMPVEAKPLSNELRFLIFRDAEPSIAHLHHEFGHLLAMERKVFIYDRHAEEIRNIDWQRSTKMWNALSDAEKASLLQYRMDSEISLLDERRREAMQKLWDLVKGKKPPPRGLNFFGESGDIFRQSLSSGLKSGMEPKSVSAWAGLADFLLAVGATAYFEYKDRMFLYEHGPGTFWRDPHAQASRLQQQDKALQALQNPAKKAPESVYTGEAYNLGQRMNRGNQRIIANIELLKAQLKNEKDPYLRDIMQKGIAAEEAKLQSSR